MCKSQQQDKHQQQYSNIKMLKEGIINKNDSWHRVIAFVICSEVCGDLR